MKRTLSDTLDMADPRGFRRPVRMVAEPPSHVTNVRPSPVVYDWELEPDVRLFVDVDGFIYQMVDR